MQNPLNQLINQENKERALEVSTYIKKIESPIDTVFSKPREVLPESVVKKIMDEQEMAKKANLRIEQGFETETNVETPANIYQEIHGETLLRNIMQLPTDNSKTELVNDYILEAMRTGKMRDTKENYEKVFNRLLARHNLSQNQQRPYVLNKLYYYLSGEEVSEDDNLILSILKTKQRGKRNGIRR